MRKKIVHVWEQLDQFTVRCQVIGGWIVVTGNGKSQSSIMVVDKDHEWISLKPKTEEVV